MRAELLRLVIEAIVAANGRPPEELTVTVDADGATMVFRARPGELAEKKPKPPPGEIERALTTAATAEPQTAKALARKAGYTYGSHVREALAALVRDGKLTKTPDGYKRVSR